MLVVVDGANVVGSRPDGWWRDRAGAAARLLDELRAAGGEGGGDDALVSAGDDDREGAGDDEFVLVLEGRARAGAEPGEGGGSVSVVHASGSGDDEIVRLVGEADEARQVIVVTSDRGLRARVEGLGAATHGPGWLWRRLGSR